MKLILSSKQQGIIKIDRWDYSVIASYADLEFVKFNKPVKFVLNEKDITATWKVDNVEDLREILYDMNKDVKSNIWIHVKNVSLYKKFLIQKKRWELYNQDKISEYINVNTKLKDDFEKKYGQISYNIKNEELQTHDYDLNMYDAYEVSIHFKMKGTIQHRFNNAFRCKVMLDYLNNSGFISTSNKEGYEGYYKIK